MCALALEDAGLKSTFHNSLFPRGFLNDWITRRDPDAADGSGGIRLKTGNCSDSSPAVQFLPVFCSVANALAARLSARSHDASQAPVRPLGMTRRVGPCGHSWGWVLCISRFTSCISGDYKSIPAVEKVGMGWEQAVEPPRCGRPGRGPTRAGDRGGLRRCPAGCRGATGFSTGRRVGTVMWITRGPSDTMGGRSLRKGEVACHWLSGNNVWIPFRMN